MFQPGPDQYNQPLAWWQNAWRFALSLAISGLAWGQIAVRQLHHDPTYFWIDLSIGLVSFPIVAFRRRWPFPVAMIGAVFGGLSGFSAGPTTLAAVSLATRRELPKVLTVGVVGVLCSMLFFVIEPWARTSQWWIEGAFSIVFTIAMMATGLYIGSRRALVWSLRERAEQAEHQQELRMDQARSLERERIAREMHDVLAHRISLVTMHAGALAYRTDLPPEQVRETAELISTKAHEALADLRQILGALREAEPMRPQPTLAELAELVSEATDSGMRVDLTNTLAEPVPDRTGRTVYRIVQEALTNARKHAPGAAVRVGVSGSAAEGITVSVHNGRVGGVNGSAKGAGLGLVGMRERVELAGGRLEILDDRSDFALTGWLPWPA